MFKELFAALKERLYQTYPLDMTGLTKVDPIKFHINYLPRESVGDVYAERFHSQKYAKKWTPIKNKCSLYPNQEQYKINK